MKKLLTFAVLAVLLSSTNLFAECKTFVSGTIVNETWTPAGSPYCVEGDILVAGLTIEPSVRVEFLGNYVFEVAGILTAIGTEQDPIVFNREESNSVGWQGIFFLNSYPGSELRYCTIEGSVNSGIRITNSIPTFENCTISDNEASQGGGVNITNSIPTFKNCTISDNEASQGGSINIDLSRLSTSDELTLEDCMITGNTSSSHGGGIKAALENGSLELIGCKITNNHSNPTQATGDYMGGGIYAPMGGNGYLLLNNCELTGNTCYSSRYDYHATSTCQGGGIWSSGGNLTLTNCLIERNSVHAHADYWYASNSAYSYGGGIYLYSGALTAVNSIVSHNSTTASGRQCSYYLCGSGVYVNGGTVDTENCTFAYNEKEGLRNTSGTVTAVNSIFYFNTGAQIAGTTTVTYSDVQNGYNGEGNLNVHPILGACLQVVPGSLCIDAGNPDPLYNDICLPPSLGTERNDMGAHGGPGACAWIYCDGDFDCDVDIDGSDLAVFAADFGRTDCDDDCEGDFDNDGDVDGSDLAVFAANFGQTGCCPK